jgi:hypothetical protein
VRYFIETPILQAGVASVGEMRSQKASSILAYFEKEERALVGCNPMLMMFAIKHLMAHKDDEHFREVLFAPNVLSNAFSIAICQVFILQKDPICRKLLKFALIIIKYLGQFEEHFLKSGELHKVAQNILIKSATKKINWQMDEEQKFFSTQQIIFLEIHLAISSMCDRISSLHGINLGKVVEDSEAICKIKQLKEILRE